MFGAWRTIQIIGGQMKGTLQSKKDREFIANPNLWPVWPYLPLKKGPQNQFTAVLFDGGFGKYKIAEDANLYKLYEVKIWKDIVLDQIISSGWKVD